MIESELMSLLAWDYQILSLSQEYMLQYLYQYQYQDQLAAQQYLSLLQHQQSWQIMTQEQLDTQIKLYQQQLQSQISVTSNGVTTSEQQPINQTKLDESPIDLTSRPQKLSKDKPKHYECKCPFCEKVFTRPWLLKGILVKENYY